MLPFCILLTFLVCEASILPPHPEPFFANCAYDDIVGKWMFYLGGAPVGRTRDCTNPGTIERRVRVNLEYPDIATDEYGNVGRWTLIYNQGFEVNVNERRYFAFSYYTQEGKNITSYCGKTFNGWSSDVTVRHWACFYGRKQGSEVVKVHRHPFSDFQETTVFENQQEIVDAVNSKQKSWRAKLHPLFDGKTYGEILKIVGGKNSWLPHRPQPAKPTREQRIKATNLPQNFDWRNQDGINYISPVRNQGTCGSCYIFSSLGMIESRLRVQTKNTERVQLSPQEVLSCSEYGQGCEGGFPYLIAGKYGLDFGFIAESCDPYRGQEIPCSDMTNCTRHYTAEYSYIGGYYGACNEDAMKIAIVERGPIAVSFEVYPDFYHYTGGIYHHVDGLTHFNPFSQVNHAVLAVGYGVEPQTGEKFWIVKNSWGNTWGENGYFMIRRGTNEAGIESISAEAIPIP